MTIALLLISDGREEYLARTLQSADENLPEFAHLIHIDDTHHTLGFAGAIREGWVKALKTDATHVFHLEQDFTFNQAVPIDDMIGVLDSHHDLAQIALLRQPWNRQERRAGGIIQMHQGDYRRVSVGGCSWFEHRRHFTTNPCLYPRWLMERGWPECESSEGHFGIRMFEDLPNARCAYWGDGEEWVTHIGDKRSGCGY